MRESRVDSLGRVMPVNRRGFGNIRLLPSGFWQASYLGPSKDRVYAPDTFGRRAEAEAWLAGERVRVFPKEQPTVKETRTDKLGRSMPTSRRRFGSLRQLPSGNWQASYVNRVGVRVRPPSTFLRRCDAEDWLASERERLNQVS
jgi:hypothetical protein